MKSIIHYHQSRQRTVRLSNEILINIKLILWRGLSDGTSTTISSLCVSSNCIACISFCLLFIILLKFIPKESSDARESFKELMTLRWFISHELYSHAELFIMIAHPFSKFLNLYNFLLSLTVRIFEIFWILCLFFSHKIDFTIIRIGGILDDISIDLKRLAKY